MYEVFLTKRARREFKKLSVSDKKKIDDSFELLKIDPRPPRSKKIRGNIHRVRNGDIRIIFSVSDKKKSVVIGKIARRSEDTYNNVDDLF